MTVESKNVRQGVREAIRVLQNLLDYRREVVRSCSIEVKNDFMESLGESLVIERRLTGISDYTIRIRTEPARKSAPKKRGRSR